MSLFSDNFDYWFKNLIESYRTNYSHLFPPDRDEFFVENTKNLVDLYMEKKDNIEKFGVKVLKRFRDDKSLVNKVHSYGFRLKDETHLAEKLIRKKIENPHIEIVKENFFSEITDLAGLRILQLYKTHIKDIHEFICNCKEWELSKEPVAYNFSPRFLKIFKELDIEVKEKSTGYSSAHYVVNDIEHKNCHCEIQVRTLFEEGWSEIDHTFNYPGQKPGKVCQTLLETLKRVCDVAVYIADQIPDIYQEEKKNPEGIEDLEIEMTILQSNLIRNLQTELAELKEKIKPSAAYSIDSYHYPVIL
jgi:ppGpp synthetase/RelA/SpoT-type nucleotidyltranferase